MRATIVLLLLAACQFSFAQTDTNFIAAGEWSAYVTNHVWPLRGRLLVYDAEKHTGNIGSYGRIYLELQNGQELVEPLEFYFDSHMSCLQFEMRDGRDQNIAPSSYGHFGFVPSPCIMTLRCRSTIRVQVDFNNNYDRRKMDGLLLETPDGRTWIIRPDATNDYYLSATFTPTNYPSALHYHVWQGTLQLPKVKIPIEKIKK